MKLTLTLCYSSNVVDKVNTDGRVTAHTCSEWQQRGLTVTTMADIDPDGEEGSLEPVVILCDLDAEPGESITVIGKQDYLVTASP